MADKHSVIVTNQFYIPTADKNSVTVTITSYYLLWRDNDVAVVAGGTSGMRSHMTVLQHPHLKKATDADSEAAGGEEKSAEIDSN